MELKYCKQCVMDGTAPELELDEHGICNFCKIAKSELNDIKHNAFHLPEIINQIKKDGRGKKYDCLIGLSGGADSSTTLHYALKYGLRPICYTIDNGWNDKRADENIMRLVEKKGREVRLYRYTIDRKAFVKLQMAFLRAGLINAEIPTDHILMASQFELAAKYGVKWIISGGNVATESIMPGSWSYNARDLTHIKDVYKTNTHSKLKGLPTCGIWKWNYYRWIKGIKVFYLLDFIDYNRAESIKMLEKEYGWKNYYEKHCESIFTWWFQNYYLYEKFGIDKRKAHLSSMILSNQMTRSEALEVLAERPVYPSLGLEEKVMKYKIGNHYDYKQDKWYSRIAKLVRLLKRYGIVR